ncbi:hypothetical protein OUZ56_006003 [Daphnia magna]|uniref:Uncharacterized protein n=1 Tax=Daphnia magna TaxID=35525 RepID=A0ABQ9YUG8_9CRUS|nr:hypothetical protein OUZ56_006003 [Daphnia magna]
MGAYGMAQVNSLALTRLPRVRAIPPLDHPSGRLAGLGSASAPVISSNMFHFLLHPNTGLGIGREEIRVQC